MRQFWTDWNHYKIHNHYQQKQRVITLQSLTSTIHRTDLCFRIKILIIVITNSRLCLTSIDCTELWRRVTRGICISLQTTRDTRDNNEQHWPLKMEEEVFIPLSYHTHGHRNQSEYSIQSQSQSCIRPCILTVIGGSFYCFIIDTDPSEWVRNLTTSTKYKTDPIKYNAIAHLRDITCIYHYYHHHHINQHCLCFRYLPPTIASSLLQLSIVHHATHFHEFVPQRELFRSTT